MDTPAPTTSPAKAANSTAPPPSDDATSSPPTPSAAPPPSPPVSSPPPPKSSPSPPPPATPPPKSESPPPPKSEAPPPEEQKSSPPPPNQSPPPQSPPAKSPSPEKSPVSPPSPVTSPPPPVTSSTPPPASVTPPSSGGSPPPPAATTVFSPPPPVEKSSTASPPPPPAVKSTTTPSGSSTSESSGKSSAVASPPPSSSSVSPGVIGAVAVIGVAVVALVVLCIVFAVRKKKRKENYTDTPVTGGPRGDYYNGSNWTTPQNIPRPPGLMGTPPGGPPGWAPPPPLPPGTASSDYTSGFSGTHPNSNSITPSPNMGFNSQSSFSYEELARATNGFAQENVIGQGGFGYVHKGVLPNGKEVAVKSLKAGSGQGEREFQAEVEIISRVHHRHLVSLVGYCIVDERRMLVYEFVPNKTLEYHLHGKGRPTMDWPTRMRIALGAAKGLGYLHEDCHPRIIHRDIKAANILLDYKFEAMVADFGLAKLTSDNYTHISTRVMGTFGYMAPEYASSGKLTEKSDVFSFGVMLLELITGRRPIDPNQTIEDSLVDWARPIMTRVLEDRKFEELVDPRLENNFDPNEMERMIACAAASIRHSARRRPKMSQIVRTLEGDQSSLNDTSKETPETLVYDTKAYNADMMKFKKMINSSTDFGSGEYDHTSDYGLHPSSSSSEMASQEFTESDPHKLRL